MKEEEQKRFRIPFYAIVGGHRVRLYELTVYGDSVEEVQRRADSLKPFDTLQVFVGDVKAERQ